MSSSAGTAPAFQDICVVTEGSTAATTQTNTTAVLKDLPRQPQPTGRLLPLQFLVHVDSSRAGVETSASPMPPSVMDTSTAMTSQMKLTAVSI